MKLMGADIIMIKKIISLVAALTLAATFTSCKKDTKKSAENNSSSIVSIDNSETATQLTSETATEPVTEHISPVETVSSELGIQIKPNTVVLRENGSNTYEMNLSDFIESGDSVSSFTFEIYSDGTDIGTFKGGCIISVTPDCPYATSEGKYQSPDFLSPTEGAYGQIKWDVPVEIREYIDPQGTIVFGYWWGNVKSVRLDTAVCTFNRTRELPVDDTVQVSIGKHMSLADKNKTAEFNIADYLSEGMIPQAVTFAFSSDASLKKYTGAFGVSSSLGNYKTKDISAYSGDTSMSLTWILPKEARSLAAAGDAKITFDYWWSESQSITLENAIVKCSLGDSEPVVVPDNNNGNGQTPQNQPSDSNFKSAWEVISDINVGWNLGNSLECYNYSSWTKDAETAWGNPTVTKALFNALKTAGFNAVRIPITWGDHMTGEEIAADWLERVQEVVDYAYDEGLYVIINMHHDDYTWFTPSDKAYEANSKKLCAIWTQISERFKSYGERLLFEGMNEPRTVNSPNEWSGGTASERTVINKYEQDFVNAVRATGGNNAERTLIITSYAASAEDIATNAVVVPDDKNIVVSIHYYAPWKFSDGQTTAFTDADKTELSNKFASLKSKFSDGQGVPVIIGEFGCVNAASVETRAEYYRYYISEAKKYGIKCFVWDNGTSSGESAYGILDRTGLVWISEILQGIINGSK